METQNHLEKIPPKTIKSCLQLDIFSENIFLRKFQLLKSKSIFSTLRPILQGSRILLENDSHLISTKESYPSLNAFWEARRHLEKYSTKKNTLNPDMKLETMSGNAHKLRISYQISNAEYMFRCFTLFQPSHPDAHSYGQRREADSSRESLIPAQASKQTNPSSQHRQSCHRTLSQVHFFLW